MANSGDLSASSRMEQNSTSNISRDVQGREQGKKSQAAAEPGGGVEMRDAVEFLGIQLPQRSTRISLSEFDIRDNHMFPA